ncbi:MAG: type I-C CRISPR-associated protein Cas7/Csd2 [Clostridiales bacterium]|jgi:CRISPR-associated protein Csd2|nr:type I-C CRISPR-associated protein Cas7/Csd2 [Clostridiales bacterium]
MTLQNKIDFAVIFTVKNANPNGDPLGGNRPRTTSDGLGEVSDVCLKRKIRNRLQTEGKAIFVQSEEFCDDGEKSLSDRFNKFKAQLPKAEQEDKKVIAKKACEKWIDVRSFGQVFALKKSTDGADAVSIGIRGPVTIQSAFTTEMIAPEFMQITKSVNSETTKDGGKSSDTMGMKHRVSRATYVTYGSISPQLAEATGFSDEDAESIKNALKTLFDNDESSARPSGSMEIKKVVWWKHNSKSAQYSSAKVHNTLTVSNDGSIELKNFSDLIPEVIDG